MKKFLKQSAKVMIATTTALMFSLLIIFCAVVEMFNKLFLVMSHEPYRRTKLEEYVNTTVCPKILSIHSKLMNSNALN